MKTTILICLAFLFSMSAVNAGSNYSMKPKSEVVKYISKFVKYPRHLQDSKRTGSVYVSFKVDQQGNLLVDKINASDSELQAYIANELAKIKIDTSKVKIDDYDQSYIVRLKFEVVD